MTDRQVNAIIGRKIRIARNSKFLYQSTLAEMIGVSTSYMSKLEAGDRVISAAIIYRIAHKLEIPPSDFDPFIAEKIWHNPRFPLE